MQVGSLVECIGEPESLAGHSNEIIPALGAILTVRAIIQHKKGPGLQFEEIINTPRQYRDGLGEVHFGVDGFREVQPPMNASSLFEDQLKVTQ